MIKQPTHTHTKPVILASIPSSILLPNTNGTYTMRPLSRYVGECVGEILENLRRGKELNQ